MASRCCIKLALKSDDLPEEENGFSLQINNSIVEPKIHIGGKEDSMSPVWEDGSYLWVMHGNKIN